MQRDNRDEDDAWRSIVENFGDRAEIDPEPTADPAAPPAPPLSPSAGQPDDDDPWRVAPTGPTGPAPYDDDWASDRFVPPPPPPVPTTTWDRTAAWLGVFGSPAVLLVCLVLAIDLPSLVAYALVAGFVGGFLYLVSQMPRGPRDPDDDGARL